MADAILLITVFLLEFLLFYFLPTLDGNGTLFGIVLENDDFQTFGSPVLRRYRRALILVAAACLVGVFLLDATNNLSTNSLAIAYIFLTVGVVFLLFKYLREAWKLRDKRTISRLAAPLGVRRLRDFSSFWLEISVIALTAAPFAVLISFYPHLPEVVPVHWNAAGAADRWSRKDLSSVFFVPVLAAFLQVFWIVLKQDIVGARFRVPAERAEQVLSLKEISLQANAGMIDWCRLAGGFLFGTLALLVLTVISPVAPFASALNVLTWASVVLLLAGMAFYLYRMILVNREIKRLTGRVTFQTADEMAGWKGGGAYYYNPQDAAFMVEKPGGVGYTVNFAHKRVLLYLALILAPIFFSFFSLLFMNPE